MNARDRGRGDGGETVFLDPSALSDLPPQLMQQDLETLVGLNIHTPDLEPIQVSADGHVVDSSGVLISDGVSVGNMVEVADEETVMDTSDPLPSGTQMEVDSLADNGQVLSEMDLLQHSHEFIPMSSNEELLDDTTDDALATKPLMNISSSVSHGENEVEDSSHIVGGEPLSTQILKTSTGQFVILQPNQTSLPISSLNSSKMFSSANLILSSLSTSTSSKNTKPSFVNATQIGGNTVRQITNLNQIQPQFRTLQLKQPISLSSDTQNSGVTKVILSSQPGSNLSQQLRLISSQANVNANAQNQNTADHNPQGNTTSNSSSKLAFQFQPFGLSLASTKNIFQSPTKVTTNEAKPTTKIKIPLTIPMRGTSSSSSSSSSSPSIHSFTQFQANDLTNQVTSHQGESKSTTAASNPSQSLIIKGNIPLGSNTPSLKPGQIIATPGTQQLIKIPVSQLSQLTSQGQTLHLPSNKVNFRIVSAGSTPQSNTVHLNNQSTVVKSINMASKPIAPANKNAKPTKAIPIQVTHSPKQQRLIIPVSNQDMTSSSTTPNSLSGIQIRPQGSITLPASALPPGVLSNAQPGSLVMIPAQYFQNASLTNHVLQTSNQNIPLSLATNQKNAPPKTVIDANVIKPRKPCNCTKSQCLKLYCDCFANGEFCNNCNCVNCYNNLSHEEDRQKAIKCCLERNPSAFRPKIGKGGSDSERRHNKGCNCKRSGCLKNYCECYEAKIPCSNMCKCVGCRNMDSCQPHERKRLMQLAEAAEARVNQHIAIKNRPFSLSSLPSPAKMSLSLSAKNSYCRISQKVVEATCDCLLAQAEKVEKSTANTPEWLELKVLNEFSRCLLQIVGFNSKTKDGSSSVQ